MNSLSNQFQKCYISQPNNGDEDNVNNALFRGSGGSVYLEKDLLNLIEAGSNHSSP